LLDYNKPFSIVLIAVLCSALQGCVYPVYGWFFVKIIFAQLSLNLPVENDPFEDIQFWIISLLILAAFSFVITYIYKSLFGFLGEQMTLQIR